MSNTFRASLLELKITSKALISTVNRLEKAYSKSFERILKEPDPVYDDSSEEILAKHNLICEHTGESMDNILKIYYLMKYYPDISLLIQTNPAFYVAMIIIYN